MDKGERKRRGRCVVVAQLHAHAGEYKCAPMAILCGNPVTGGLLLLQTVRLRAQLALDVLGKGAPKKGAPLLGTAYLYR